MIMEDDIRDAVLRLLKMWLENPELLDELIKRLECDEEDLVD
jgi:hypothetical protein